MMNIEKKTIYEPYRPLLWSRSNIIASHLAGTVGSVFLVEVFPEFFLNCKTNVSES